MDKAVYLIMTGGTIDGSWDSAQDTMVITGESFIPTYFQKLNLELPLQFRQVCMKDSRALTNEDLERLLQAIQEAQTDKIIVTHGTYTMIDTAKFLEKRLGKDDKVVVLTGSVSPLKTFEVSDAPFNLGYAFSQVQNLKPGVYLAINGRTFSLEQVVESLAEGKFYSVFAEKQ